MGYSLIKMYEAIGIPIYQPYLRAQMERDMKEVCDGLKPAQLVYREMHREMKNIFENVYDKR
jgi:DNA topoisomerase IA